MPKAETGRDHVGRLRDLWSKSLPDVDTEGMAIIGRARRITLALRPGIEAIFKAHGLDAGEFDVLASILRAGPPYRLRPTELYRALMISSGGLTDRLARLEERGLIRRISAPDDKRSLLVELSKQGQRRAEAAFREDMVYEKDMLSGLTGDEKRTLAALLAKLAAHLEDAD